MKNIREETEELEYTFISPFGTKARESKGRLKEEKECDIRTCFARDRDRIIHSKSFRKLKHKTQVFYSPEVDYYRTRLTHALEVSQISQTIGRALRLNNDLIEAISLGHDLGHTPFGHDGERALNEIMSDGFEHNKHSLRIVDSIERDGRGLNLTVEVRDGILNHQTKSMPLTLEGKVVRLCDKIAYLHHDMDDGIRAGILKEEDVPKEFREILGETLEERLDNLIVDVINSSRNKDDIILSEDKYKALLSMKGFMFKNLYKSHGDEDDEEKVINMIKELFDYYYKNPEKMTDTYYNRINDKKSKEIIVGDYIAGMTDTFATNMFQKIRLPRRITY